MNLNDNKLLAYGNYRINEKIGTKQGPRANERIEIICGLAIQQSY